MVYASAVIENVPLAERQRERVYYCIITEIGIVGNLFAENDKPIINYYSFLY